MPVPIVARPTRALLRSATSSASACATCSGNGRSRTTTSPAELAERADLEHFWKAHIALMTRSEALTEEDLVAVARDLGLAQDARDAEDTAERAKGRVDRRSERPCQRRDDHTDFLHQRPTL